MSVSVAVAADTEDVTGPWNCPYGAGTRTCYVQRRCRCDSCRTANRLYQRQRERHLARVRYGIAAPALTHVDAGETRRHLRWLRRQGVGLRSVSRRSGVTRNALRDIVDGRTVRVTLRVQDRVLGVGRSAGAPGQLVDAAATWELIDDLLLLGYRKARLARELGQRGSLQLGRRQVTRRSADKVAWMHFRLRDCAVSWHGTLSGYREHRCRCRACRAASAAARAGARRRRPA